MIKAALSQFVRQTPLRWYLPNKVDRMEVIQRAIDGLGAKTYLEIGVDEGACFCAVRVPVKVGVDPVTPRPAVVREMARPGVTYVQATSDEFFERDAASVLAGGVDVVFIDGLHTYGQTYRDVRNALPHLAPGGLILLHDCLPETAEEARAAETYAEARALNGPGWNGLWTGESWKAVAAVRAGHPDAQGCVLTCDHGVGLVYKAPNPSMLAFTPAEIDALGFDDLMRDPHGILGLRRPAHLFTVLRALAADRG